METGGTVPRILCLSRRRQLGRKEVSEVSDTHAPFAVHQCPGIPADALDQRPDRWNREPTAIFRVEVGLIESVGLVAVAILAHSLVRELEQDLRGVGVNEAVQFHPPELSIMSDLSWSHGSARGRSRRSVVKRLHQSFFQPRSSLHSGPSGVRRVCEAGSFRPNSLPRRETGRRWSPPRGSLRSARP